MNTRPDPDDPEAMRRYVLVVRVVPSRNYVSVLLLDNQGNGTFRESAAGEEDTDKAWTLLYSGTERGGKHGVGLALDSEWAAAWRRAGACVEYVSARLLRARFIRNGRFITVVSVYAPTFPSSEAEHARFWSALQKLMQEGNKIRVYVPYGDNWYDYSIRRLKENPKMAGYIIKNLFKKIFYFYK